MKVAELAEQTSRQFSDVYRRFEVIDERFAVVDERFNAVDERFDLLESKMDRRFDNLERIMLGFHDRLTADQAMLHQEQTMHGGRLNRHERWLEELAAHARYRLKS